MSQPQPLGQETLEPDEAALIDRMVELQRKLHDRSARPVLRAQHPKHHGLALGELVVGSDLDPELREGIFREPGRYTAWARFSNARGDDDAAATLRGLAVKVVGLEAFGRPDQDFLAIDHPAFFIRNLADYVGLFEALVAADGGFPRSFLFPSILPWRWRFSDLQNLRSARHRRGSLLGVTYHSTTPYRLGPLAIKFAFVPGRENGGEPEPGRTKTYLGERLAAHLKDKPASFDLMVLKQTDSAKMPIEDPTVDWAKATPRPDWRKVATLHLKPQVPNTPERMELAQNMAFNPWHTLEEHRPIGGINRARRAVYPALSGDRLSANGHRAPEMPAAAV